MTDISFHITDITENSLGAGAGRILISIVFDGPVMTLTISDDGRGMDKETLERVVNPFYTTRTTRRVGLGLPFLMQNAAQSGGGVDIGSEPGVGTTVKAVFMLDNIDCPPAGDLAGTVSMLITGNPSVNIVFEISDGSEEFSLSTSELKEIMDGVPLGHPEVSSLIREIISENIAGMLRRAGGTGLS